MDIILIILTAIALSMDCFAVALGISCSGKKISRGATIRVAVTFSIAQGLLLVIGWLAGHSLVSLIAGYDHWVVFGLLLLVGAHMIWESFHEETANDKIDLTRGWALISMAVITSIDDLATGLALAFEQVNIPLAAMVVAIVTFIIVMAGFFIGRKLGELLGRWAGVIGGLILIGIGTRVLIEHLAG